MPRQQTVNSSLLHLPIRPNSDMEEIRKAVAEKLNIERLEEEGWEVVEEVEGDDKEEKGEKKKEKGDEKEDADDIEAVAIVVAVAIDQAPDERYLKLDEEIGRGSFKTVFKGELLYAVMVTKGLVLKSFMR